MGVKGTYCIYIFYYISKITNFKAFISSFSILWSLKTCFMLHRKILKTQKIFFRFRSSFAAILWGLFASLRRLQSIIGFFTPSLGLFNTLYHWLAEQYTFTMRSNYHPHPNDQIQLFNMTRKIFWKEFDRTTYEFPNEPAPPFYTHYTGFSLKYSVAVFFMLMVFKIIAITLVKYFSSAEFREYENHYNKMMHVLQCFNFPFPYVDWDEGMFSIDEYKKRFRKTEMEMALSFAVTSFFSVVMMLPIWYTGMYVPICVISRVVSEEICLINLFIFFQIIASNRGITS